MSVLLLRSNRLTECQKYSEELWSPGVQRGGGGGGGHGARGRGGEGPGAGGRGEVGHQEAGHRVVAVGGRHRAGRV